ncbi:FliM/FliN family flagellar motor C-terminal domain-containing protein [Hyphomonas oceanitis]|nr:FliM/FliN family flagellar motor C-terminal domain-containing protein [Hyphomonas oceanitis]
MSAILRKKIEAGAGVPPSIANLRPFWEQVQSSAEAWAHANLGAETMVKIIGRRVIGASAADDILEDPFTFFMAANLSSGIASVTLDNRIAIQCAAARLHQDVESLADASSLFLKLLCEQTSVALWQKMGAPLEGHEVSAKQSPLCDSESAVGGFDNASRYLRVDLELEFGGGVSVLKIMYAFDFMQQHAQTELRHEEVRKQEACQQTPKSLSASIRASGISLDVVLERMTLTIAECSRLEVGNVLPLANADANRLSLCAETINGSVDIGLGELGVWKRQRAVKLHTPISENFARELVDL